MSAQNILARNTSRSLNASKLKTIKDEEVDKLLSDANIALALKSNITIIKSLQTTISSIEKAVVKQVKLRPEYKQLLSVSGKQSDITPLTKAVVFMRITRKCCQDFFMLIYAE